MTRTGDRTGRGRLLGGVGASEEANPTKQTAPSLPSGSNVNQTRTVIQRAFAFAFESGFLTRPPLLALALGLTLGAAALASAAEAPVNLSPAVPQDQVKDPTVPWPQTVLASGDGPLFYQWFVDGDPVPNATGPTFGFLAPRPCENGITHLVFCVVSNEAGSFQTRVAHITSNIDGLPFSVRSVTVGSRLDTVTVEFDRPLLADTPTDILSYVLEDEAGQRVEFRDGTLSGPRNEVVTLRLLEGTFLAPGGHYRLSMQDGSILSSCPEPLPPTVVPFQAPSTTPCDVFRSDHPLDTTMLSFSVLLAEAPPGLTASFQWFADGTPVFAATNNAIGITNRCNSYIGPHRYYCQVTTWLCTFNTRTALVDVLVDDAPPQILRVHSDSTRTTVLAKFDRPMAADGVDDPFAFQLLDASGANLFSQASLDDTGTRLRVDTSAPLADGATYRLVVARDTMRDEACGYYLNETTVEFRSFVEEVSLRVRQLDRWSVKLEWADPSMELQGADSPQGPWSPLPMSSGHSMSVSSDRYYFFRLKRLPE